MSEVEQAAAAMPVTTDALLLADFTEPVKGQRILDLGCGSGVIAFAIASREQVNVLGIDNDLEAVEQAIEKLDSVRETLIGEVELQPGDLRNEEFMGELGEFDQIVCNPPFYKVDNGRLPSKPRRAACRHELTCTLEEVIVSAAWALKDGGILSMVHIPGRLPELLGLLESSGFGAVEILPVYTRRRQSAERVLIRARRGAKDALRLLPSLQLRTLAKV